MCKDHNKGLSCKTFQVRSGGHSGDPTLPCVSALGACFQTYRTGTSYIMMMNS